MATKVRQRIQIMGGAPNVDELYGPYNSVQEAFDLLGPDDWDVLLVGLTVGIRTDNGIQEYWFKSKCESVADLVAKLTDPSQLSEIQETVNENTQTLLGIDETLKEINKKIATQERAQATDEWLVL